MDELLFVLIMALRVFTVYFAAVALFALRKRKAYPTAAPGIRFAVVIAARNEEAVIGDLVASLLAQRYPAELRDVYVVPNNCTDFTQAVAAASGARILTCLGPVASKGEALRQAFAQLRGRGYDAFVVFDADNIAHPDFLARMNDAFAAGAMVCKARMRTANPTQSGIAGCYGLYFAGFDWMFNRPRAACGLSAKLVGTGFAVRREVLERLGGWNTQTIAEDAEFAVQCAAAGYRVHWVEQALTYDEAPNRVMVSLRQRKRWCSGVMQVGRRELKRLWRAPAVKPWLRWDMTMFLLAPFAQAFSGLLLGVSLVLDGQTGLAALGSTLAVSYGALLALGFILCLAERYPLRGMGRAILLFPLFMASWLPLEMLSLVKDTRQWGAVPHLGRQAADCRM